MGKRYFNWKLAIVLLIAFVVLGATAVGLRQWQRSRRAEHGLEAGLDAYKQQKWEEAAMNLGRYLAVKRDDVAALLKYAEAQLNIRPAKPDNVQQAIAAYRAVLRIDKSNSEAAMRLTEIYLGIGSPGEAELIAKRQLETNKDPELRRMFALALAGQRKFAEASAELKSIISEQPDQILAYETLGRLTEQRPEDFPDPPAHWFNQAVENNPSSALAYIIRASFYLRSKNQAEAVADLEQAEKLNLSDPDVRLRLTIEFINADVLDKAEGHLGIVQVAKPTDQMLWQTWAQLALKSQSQTKMAEVAEAGLRELSSQPWDFIPMAAELFIRAGQPDRATECISKLRQKDLLPATVAFLEGLVADQKGQTYEAVKSWRRAIGLGNKSLQVRLALASAFSLLGDPQSALRELRSLVSERPTFEAHMALARLLARTGNWAEMAEQARRAMQLSPENLEAVLHYLRAQINLLVAQPTAENARAYQDIESRLATLEKATDGATDVKLLQFQLSMQQNDFTRAETLLAQLKQDHPSQSTIALAEAELFAVQDKTNEAISTLKQAIKESPKAVELVSYLGMLLLRQGNREECEIVIKDALARVEQTSAQRELGLLLAQIYSQQGEQDKAYEFLRTLTKKLPNDIPLKRRFLMCKQVVSNPEKAQQIVNDIKALEGEDGWQWRYEQARVWFAGDDFKRRYPQITSLLQENLLANPNDQASRMLLAAAYEQAGESQLAISIYREALARSPNDLRIIIPAVAALYRAREYDQADEILNRASQEKLYHPDLQRLQLQSHVRRGQLSTASDILQDILRNDPNDHAACFSLALLKMRQNQFAEAEQLLAKLKAQNPNSLPVIYAQIQLSILQDKPQDALGICNEMVDGLNNASAHILRARTYTALGQTNPAAEDLERATAIEPNNIEVWIARSEFYRSMDRPDLAIADIEQALSLAPDNVQVQKRAISLLLASGQRERLDKGRAILRKALESNPEDIELRLSKARLLLAEGTAPAIQNAEQVLQDITEEHPAVAQAWVLLGEIFLRRAEPAKAIDAAMRGLVHQRNDKFLLLLKARAEAARSPSLAIPTFKSLRELDPNDVDIAVQLAMTYIAADESEKAVNLLEEQLISCKDNVQERRVNTALAVALYKNGNKTDAQKKFDSLLQFKPDDSAPLLAQAQLLLEDELWSQLNQSVTHWCENNPDDVNTPITIAGRLAATENNQAKEVAESLLRGVLGRHPDNLAAMSRLAMLLQIAGRNTESAKLYEKILELSPDNVIAMNNLAWIMCEERNNYQEALELAQRGLKIAPQYIDLIDTRGMVYYRLGEFDKAIQDFSECIRLYPSGVPAAVASRFHLGRAFAKLGQTNKAIEYLNQALDLHRRIGGLSTADLTEAQRLLEQLQGGG